MFEDSTLTTRATQLFFESDRGLDAQEAIEEPEIG
jgi:hypothetical protein